MGSQMMPKIPVIDLNKTQPGSRSWLSACKDVCNALEEYGCFVAIYDKVSPELNKAIFAASEELFELPTDTKIKNITNTPYFGYVGQLSTMPLHESMGVDDAVIVEKVQNFTNLMWPTGNKCFSETAHLYSEIIAELEQMVIKMVLENYGIDMEKHSELEAESSIYLLRFMKHKAPNVEGSVEGFRSHTDKTFMSILQQNHVNGCALEIKPRNCTEWIGVEPMSSSFMVIAGDAMMGWSNDRIYSCLHRVSMSGNKARYSLGLFCFIRGIIKVPEELVNEKHPLKYKPFDNIGFVHFFSTEEGSKAEFPIKAYCGL